MVTYCNELFQLFLQTWNQLLLVKKQGLLVKCEYRPWPCVWIAPTDVMSSGLLRTGTWCILKISAVEGWGVSMRNQTLLEPCTSSSSPHRNKPSTQINIISSYANSYHQYKLQPKLNLQQFNLKGSHQTLISSIIITISIFVKKIIKDCKARQLFAWVGP